MSTHNIAEAILMSTHNIGFYEDLTKIIFELSSNIIKYAPYFFCWLMYTVLLTLAIWSTFISSNDGYRDILCVEFLAFLVYSVKKVMDHDIQ